jgi:hypothetical protein
MPKRGTKQAKKRQSTRTRKISSRKSQQRGGGYILPMEYFGVQGSRYFKDGSPSVNTYAPMANDVTTVPGQENIYVDAKGGLYAGQNLVPGNTNFKTLMVGGGKKKLKSIKKTKKGHGKETSSMIKDLQKRFV